jgi:hypothetical protein
MNIEIKIHGSADPATSYITWAPAACQIVLTNPGEAANLDPEGMRRGRGRGRGRGRR